MERDQLVRSVLAGESSVRTTSIANDSTATPTTSQPVATPRTLLSERSARRTPKMCRFRGSSFAAAQTPQQRAARPVSLFVDVPSTAGGTSGLVRSNSLKKIPESTGSASGTPVSPPGVDLSPQLESALGKQSATADFKCWEEGELSPMGAPYSDQNSSEVDQDLKYANYLGSVSQLSLWVVNFCLQSGSFCF